MIRDIFIAARGEGTERNVEPPLRELGVSVVGPDAYLDVVPLDLEGNRQPRTERIVVPVQSLLLALQAQVDDEQRRTA